MNIEQVNNLRKRLKYAWVPFFTRFGKLTPIQIETIPKILNGSNVIVASPTASGKTEAVVAPVAEKFMQEQWQGLAVLYIVPTRALANDTLERIKGPLGDMGIQASLKHGDRPYLSSKNLPNVLITTPESLDSLICRHSSVFNTVRTVVLDEIHLLDNTYRGDQLRLLLWRLARLINGSTYSLHLLSATFSAPDDIARRYVLSFDVIEVPVKRDIEYCFINSYQEVYRLVRDRGWRKILCFCNMRESVEVAVSELAKLWHPYPVVAHHGALSRPMREEAEKIMQESDIAICVATSTLEVGIDIGNIDLVVLIETPWSVSSLLQRIGRGNRREEVVRAAAIVESDEEKFLLDKMFKAAMSGVLPEEVYKPDQSVAVQQIFSLLYQNTQGVSQEEIPELCLPLCSDEEVQLILGHLQKKKWIEFNKGRWYASTKLMDLGEKGQIHSNIADSKTHKVIDIESGNEVGKIAGVFDEVFALAGRVWQVVSVEQDIIKVRRSKKRALAPHFKRRKNVGAFYWLLPTKLKAGLNTIEKT